LNEPGLTSAGFLWTGSTPAGLQEACGIGAGDAVASETSVAKDLVAHGTDLVAHGKDLVAHGKDLVAHGKDLVAHGKDLVAHGTDL